MKFKSIVFRSVFVLFITAIILISGCQKSENPAPASDKKKNVEVKQEPGINDKEENAASAELKSADKPLTQIKKKETELKAGVESLLAEVEKQKQELLKNTEELNKREKKILEKEQKLAEQESSLRVYKMTAIIVIIAGVVFLVAGIIVLIIARKKSKPGTTEKSIKTPPVPKLKEETKDEPKPLKNTPATSTSPKDDQSPKKEVKSK